VSEDELDYSFTVVDAEIYVRPWLAEYAMTRTQGQLHEMSCHEGNQSVANVLQGGRMTDLRAAQVAKAAGTARAKPKARRR
jgi:hypothetical protein